MAVAYGKCTLTEQPRVKIVPNSTRSAPPWPRYSCCDGTRRNCSGARTAGVKRTAATTPLNQHTLLIRVPIDSRPACPVRAQTRLVPHAAPPVLALYYSYGERRGARTCWGTYSISQRSSSTPLTKCAKLPPPTCRRPPPHYTHQIYAKSTPNLLATPLIFNKVS